MGHDSTGAILYYGQMALGKSQSIGYIMRLITVKIHKKIRKIFGYIKNFT